MKHLIVLIALLFITAGCVTSVGTRLDSWIGSDIQEFALTIGGPTSVTKYEDSIQYYWFRSGVINTYPITTCNQWGCTTTGGQPIHWACHLTMTTDLSGIILSHNARGMC